MKRNAQELRTSEIRLAGDSYRERAYGERQREKGATVYLEYHGM
jgi:hypothetical protein